MEAIEITVEVLINAPMEIVWKTWNTPSDVMIWNTASEDWHTTHSEIDLKIGGKFSSRMEAKDGSFGFDFWGTYSQIEEPTFLEIFLGDGRKMSVFFTPEDAQTKVKEVFEAETENTIDLQKSGWQAILNNFKKYVENQ
jgi:uncharacterized protein YndB with AHSA1/START domain